MEFCNKWRKAFEDRFQLNTNYCTKVPDNVWNESPGAKREYNTIENYKLMTPQTENQDEINRMKEDIK